MTTPRNLGQKVRPPAAVAWAIVFNLVHIVAGLALLVAWGQSARPYRADVPLDADPVFVVVAAGLTLLIGGFTLVLVSLRRGRAAAWIAQLILICLVVGLSSLPGLLWIPLLIAWCSTPVRDWFDPPSHRRFG